MFPATHRQALGMLGLHGTDGANMTMHHSECDLCCRRWLDDQMSGVPGKILSNATCCISIWIRPISKTVTADIPIVGDARLVLEADARTAGAGEVSAAAG
ncbi:hypothetical protein ACNKHK_00495 [Shigella flexneri]